jgi:hypothetical protein
MLRIEDNVLKLPVITEAIDELRVVESNPLRESPDRDAEEYVNANTGRSGQVHMTQGLVNRIIDMCAPAFIGNRSNRFAQ